MIACRQGQRTAGNHVSRGGDSGETFDDHGLSLKKGPDARACPLIKAPKSSPPSFNAAGGILVRHRNRGLYLADSLGLYP